MKTLLLCLLLCATPAWADSISLIVTSGQVKTDSMSTWDFGYRLEGDGFTFAGGRSGFDISTYAQGPLATGVVLVPFSPSPDVSFDTWKDGIMTLTQERVLVFPNLSGQPFGTSASDFTPFTMYAHRQWGDGIDLWGHGIAEARICRGCPHEALTLTWTFSAEPTTVPEPSALLMVGVGLVGLLAVKARLAVTR